MPNSSSRPQIGRDLDVGAYIQDKSLQRSVSISESSNSASAHVSDGGPTLLPYPGGRFASGGGVVQASPSPLSSTTATTTPDSPLPPSVASQFAQGSQLLNSPCNNQHPLAMLSEHSTPPPPPPQMNTQGSSTFNQLSPNPVVSLPSSLQTIDARRTVVLLSHLIDSRVPSEWRSHLDISRTASPRSPSAGIDVPDATPTSIHSPYNNCSSDNLEAAKIPRYSSPVRNSTTDDSSSPSTFVSPRLVACACHLTDLFESRYRETMGSLLDDVSRLNASRSTTTDSSPSEVPVEETIRRPNLVNARKGFHRMLNELFKQCENWGRVVAMLAFTRALCEYVETGLNRAATVAHPADHETELVADSSSVVEEHQRPSPEAPRHRSVSTEEVPNDLASTPADQLTAAHYIVWAAEFIHGSRNLWTWIHEHGGWDGLVVFETKHGFGDPNAAPGDADGGPFDWHLSDQELRNLVGMAVSSLGTPLMVAAGLAVAFAVFFKRFF